MAWARTLAGMAPKNSRPLIYFMAGTIISLSGTVVFLAKETNEDNKSEVKRWQEIAERERREKADCQVGMIIHYRQDAIKDSIDKVYSRQQVEMLQNRIDTLKSLIR